MKTPKVCLDTDVLQAYLRNEKAAIDIIAKAEKETDLATTPLNIFELFCLAATSEKAKENSKIIHELIQRLTIIEMTPEACEMAAKLFAEGKKKRYPPDARDLIVGFLSKQQNFHLCTLNESNYAAIPGLKIYK